ncbi:MAG: hypothetical protein ACOH2D_11565 [Gelidibacter sp.]
MWFRVDFLKLGVELLPTFLRKPVLSAFIKTCVAPIASIYDDWHSNRIDNLYMMEHTGQVCSLRKSLNDKFDPELRRIYIGNGNLYDAKFIHTPAENKPEFLGSLFIFSRDETSDTGVDFNVFVPVSIATTQAYELRAHVDFYKEGVKRYTILEL